MPGTTRPPAPRVTDDQIVGALVQRHLSLDELLALVPLSRGSLVNRLVLLVEAGRVQRFGTHNARTYGVPT